MNLLNSKKGQGTNYLSGIIFLIMFVFMSMIGVLFMVNVLDVYETSSYNTGQMQTAINSFRNSYYFWDYIVVVLVAVLILGSGITAYKLRTSAIGYIITFIMAFFWGFISYIMNYWFLEMFTVSAFSSVTVYFPKSLILLTNCHWIMLAFIIFGSIGLYAKKQTDSEMLT